MLPLAVLTEPSIAKYAYGGCCRRRIRRGTGRQIYFLEGLLSLQEFSVNSPLTPYYCGTKSFCEELASMLG